MTLDAKYIASNLSACANANLLRNSEFNNDSVWTLGVQGSVHWVFAGGAITATLPGIFSSTHTINQEITGSVAGTYLMLSEWTLSNIAGDTGEIRFRFYDEDDNVLGAMDFTESSNGTFQIEYEFTTLVPVKRIEMWAWVFSGSSINISVPFIKLYNNPAFTAMNQDGDINVNVTTCLVVESGIFDETFGPEFN